MTYLAMVVADSDLQCQGITNLAALRECCRVPFFVALKELGSRERCMLVVVFEITISVNFWYM